MMKKNSVYKAPNILSERAFQNWLWVVVFAMAFAWVESAVVVYLRKIYFPGGFDFPLFVKWEGGKHVVDTLIRIEFGREIATIVMLVGIGWVAGRNRFQRFCYFMLAFGIWDIFYYVWLYVMIGWPESLMTWDLLFYVPLPWVGPVITPVLIALTMVVVGSLIIYFDEKGFRPCHDCGFLLGLEEHHSGARLPGTHRHPQPLCLVALPAGLHSGSGLFYLPSAAEHQEFFIIVKPKKLPQRRQEAKKWLEKSRARQKESGSVLWNAAARLA
jgi:hypothetical protein